MKKGAASIRHSLFLVSAFRFSFCSSFFVLTFYIELFPSTCLNNGIAFCMSSMRPSEMRA
jgi:hypothetical protein